MKTPALLPIFSVFLFCGCDQLIDQPAKTNKSVKAPQVKENRVPVHRFALVRTDADVAFDTQTGQICRTWEWKSIGKTKTSDEGGTIPRNFGELAPTCLSLYQQYPSGVSTQTEALSDE